MLNNTPKKEDILATLDIFSGSAFQLRSLTENINKIPPQFSYLLSQEGLFKESGCSNKVVMIEERENVLQLIPNSNRGTNGTAIPREKRKVRAFSIPHKQVNDEILADQVQGVRMFGSETEAETVASVVADRLQQAADSMQLTLEAMCVGAVKGEVLDADESVITNMFDEFEQKQHSEKWNISEVGNVKKRCNHLVRRTIQTLGGTPVREFHILCGDDIFDAIETSEELREANKWRNNSDFLVDSHAYRYFEYAGVRFVNYQGYVGDKQFIPAGEAYLLPIGVPGLFTINYAPADYTETVNTVGIKYYAKQERMPFDKGIWLECQTNPLVLCTRPAALCKITLA